MALAIDPGNYDAFSSLRAHLETASWDEAVVFLFAQDKERLAELVRSAWQKLSQPRIQIPFQEHRELHLTIYRRLNNPFVVALLAAYWDAYEAVELNTFADLGYLQAVWRYHERIVAAHFVHVSQLGKQLLAEHMRLLSTHGTAMEASIGMNGVASTLGSSFG